MIISEKAVTKYGRTFVYELSPLVWAELWIGAVKQRSGHIDSGEQECGQVAQHIEITSKPPRSEVWVTHIIELFWRCISSVTSYSKMIVQGWMPFSRGATKVSKTKCRAEL